MSNVTKCDICGAIYGYDPEKKHSNISVHTSKHFYDPATDSYADLCPDCTKKMLEFIDVLKSGKRYVIWQDDANLLSHVRSVVFSGVIDDA